MRRAVIHDVSHRRTRRHRADRATHDDLGQQRLTADGPNRVWFTDIAQHRAAYGWVYCCAVIDAWIRRIIGDCPRFGYLAGLRVQAASAVWLKMVSNSIGVSLPRTRWRRRRW